MQAASQQRQAGCIFSALNYYLTPKFLNICFSYYKPMAYGNKMF